MYSWSTDRIGDLDTFTGSRSVLVDAMARAQRADGQSGVAIAADALKAYTGTHGSWIHRYVA